MHREGRIDEATPFVGQGYHPEPPVARHGGLSRHEADSRQAINPLGQAPVGDHRGLGQVGMLSCERRTRPAQSTQDVELPFAETELGVDLGELLGEVSGEAVKSANYPLGTDIKIGSLLVPLCLNSTHVIQFSSHGMQHIASMETCVCRLVFHGNENVATAGVTAVAPIAWGSTYFVTRNYLPPGSPWVGSSVRALPAGLILLALRPRLPHGSWWWRSVLISVLTVGGFFVLIYVAGQRLPSSVAATLMASSAAVVLLLAWPIAGERPGLASMLGVAGGLAGVAMLVGTSESQLEPVGLLASAVAVLSSSTGFVLAKRWKPPVPPVTFAGWQLTIGGLILTPIALVVDGVPTAPTATQSLAFLYLVLPATAMAYTAWFNGLQRLPATTVGIIGLLNPLTGTVLGFLAAGERLSHRQLVGVALILLGSWVHFHRLRPSRRAPRRGPPDHTSYQRSQVRLDD